jgi:ubiquinone/menaquinone biosynthesis C-methylase UbiE
MLRMARVWPGRRRRRISWRRGTAEQLPVADDVASVVWAIATVHHWHDVDAGLAEARRVLRPGGRLVAIERWRPSTATTGLASHGWTDEQAAAFADACRAAGFDVARPERRGALIGVVAH